MKIFRTVNDQLSEEPFILIELDNGDMIQIIDYSNFIRVKTEDCMAVHPIATNEILISLTE